MDFLRIWRNIQNLLNNGRPDWQDWINNQAGQISAISKRQDGYKLSDIEIFEGIVKAVLSNNTDWSRIEAVLPQLSNLFHNFDLSFYAEQTPSDMKTYLFHGLENGRLVLSQ